MPECSECGRRFESRYVRKTCSDECSLERHRRVTRERTAAWTAKNKERHRAAMRAAYRTKARPNYDPNKHYRANPRRAVIKAQIWYWEKQMKAAVEIGRIEKCHSKILGYRKELDALPIVSVGPVGRPRTLTPDTYRTRRLHRPSVRRIPDT